MQSELATMLQQKNHLAALGLAVSKVSHDLRNMLTSAQLISYRLANVEDPTVKRFAPKLISSLDRAIEFVGDLRATDADRPFFLYFATGACHSPHHAPREWIERYRGVFDDGWDALRERVL